MLFGSSFFWSLVSSVSPDDFSLALLDLRPKQGGQLERCPQHRVEEVDPLLTRCGPSPGFAGPEVECALDRAPSALWLCRRQGVSIEDEVVHDIGAEESRVNASARKVDVRERDRMAGDRIPPRGCAGKLAKLLEKLIHAGAGLLERAHIHRASVLRPLAAGVPRQSPGFHLDDEEATLRVGDDQVCFAVAQPRDEPPCDRARRRSDRDRYSAGSAARSRS